MSRYKQIAKKNRDFCVWFTLHEYFTQNFKVTKILPEFPSDYRHWQFLLKEIVISVTAP